MTSLLEGCTSSYLGVFDSLGLQTKASVTVCAPLVLHIHNCKFLFRFPSETSQVQTIKFRRVIKGGECAPGGVGGSSAGLRPGIVLQKVQPQRFHQISSQRPVNRGLSSRATHLPPLASQDFRRVGKFSASRSTAKTATHQK